MDQNDGSYGSSLISDSYKTGGIKFGSMGYWSVGVLETTADIFSFHRSNTPILQHRVLQKNSVVGRNFTKYQRY